MSTRRSGDSWGYFFSSERIIEGTFDLLREVEAEGGSMAKKSFRSRMSNLTSDRTEPPRKFLEDLGLIESVSFNYNVTDMGRWMIRLLEEGKRRDFATEVYRLVKERYQIAVYLDKFIASPGLFSFKKKEFETFVVSEWLLDFGYWKDDRIDRENALAVADWLGVIRSDTESQEYAIATDFKTEFFDIEFLAIVRELANFRNEWATIDFSERLQVRHREYMKARPDILFVLNLLVELQKVNARAFRFSPGWPTPPIPPAYAFMIFDPRGVATLRAPRGWGELVLRDKEGQKD